MKVKLDAFLREIQKSSNQRDWSGRLSDFATQNFSKGNTTP